MGHTGSPLLGEDLGDELSKEVKSRRKKLMHGSLQQRKSFGGSMDLVGGHADASGFSEDSNGFLLDFNMVHTDASPKEEEVGRFVGLLDLPEDAFSGLLSDAEFTKEVQKMRRFVLDPKKDPEVQKQEEEVRTRLVGRLKKLGVEEAAADLSISQWRFTETRRYVVSRALLSSKLDPKKREQYVSVFDDLAGKYKRGIYTRGEYLKKIDLTTQELVEESGDSELQATLNEYVEREKSYSEAIFSDNTRVFQESDERAVDLAGTSKALKDVENSGFNLEINEDTNSGHVSLDDFSTDILVYKDERQRYVYYLIDDFSNNGYTRVPPGENIAMAVRKRQIDSYLTMELRRQVVNPIDQISDLPDEMLVKVGQDLLINPFKGSFRIDGDNKVIMDGLVQLLANTDPKFSSLYSKVKNLIVFFEKDENTTFLRKEILKGNVSSLIISKLSTENMEKGFSS